MTDIQKNFTYILGAGASVETVPIVNDIPSGLHEFCVDMENAIHNTQYNKTELKPLRELCEEIKETIINVKSFDTYAKKMWLSGEIKKYNDYRRAFSAFIMYRSLIKPIDKRYDLFFASLIDKVKCSPEIPSNVNIISWNYDQLVEMSLCHVLGLGSSDLAQRINIYSNYTDIQQTENPNRFSLVKLNGTAGRKFDYNEISVKPNTQENGPLSNKKLNALEKVRMYFSFLNTSETHKLEIDFSWSDDKEYIKNVRDKAKSIIDSTDYLIVIGYSFPTFNRTLDKYLLNGMKSEANVYIQSPEQSISSVRQKFCSITNMDPQSDQVISVTSTDEFYIPFEYHGIFNTPVFLL